MKVTMYESALGPIEIVVDEICHSVCVSMPGGWMFAKRHTGDDGVQLDFGHVRIEDDVRVK